MNATLFTNMMYIDKVISICVSFISGGIVTLVTTDAGDVFLVVLRFRDPTLGPKIYSYAMMSSLVTGTFGN